jgi:hypothetical protein
LKTAPTSHVLAFSKEPDNKKTGRRMETQNPELLNPEPITLNPEPRTHNPEPPK